MINYQQGRKCPGSSPGPGHFLPCWLLIIQSTIEFFEVDTVEENYFLTISLAVSVV